jgi:hypothetical protein
MKPFLVLALCSVPLTAQIIPDTLVRSVLEDVSVPNILSHAKVLSSQARDPNSKAFFRAAQYAAEQAQQTGLSNVRIERFERNKPMWDAVAGTLELRQPEVKTLETLAGSPLLVMQRSLPGDVSGFLVEADAVDVKGKIILAARQTPTATAWKALSGRGALGLISAERLTFFGRQTPDDAVAWLNAPAGAVAMAISPKRARELSALMANGPVEVRMVVETAESSPGAIGMVMAELPGRVPDQDIVLVAHLDHQNPGANDNASGAAVLLEIARAMKSMPALKRTVRFWWSTEIESERQYFRAHPEEAKKMLLAVNLDQAGGDRQAENHMIVIYGPDWLPSWADDLIHNLVEDVQARYAPAEHAPSPMLVAEGGSQQALDPVYWPYAPLSDHLVFEDRSVGVPAISLAVPSLGVIHTDADTFDRLDPTWLKRSALFMLAPALFVANAGPNEARPILEYSFKRAVARIGESESRGHQLELEVKRVRSIRRLDPSLDPEPYVKKLEAVAAALR